MAKRRILAGIISLLFMAAAYLFVRFNNAEKIEEDCLASDFEEAFGHEDSIVLHKIYDFSQIFSCRSWDEVLIVGGPSSSRATILLKEGIALPEIDYRNRAQGSLLFYFIEDGRLISPPLEYYNYDFLYFKDFNEYDYVKFSRQDAVFKCVKLHTIGFEDEILTFEPVNRNKNK